MEAASASVTHQFSLNRMDYNSLDIEFRVWLLTLM